MNIRKSCYKTYCNFCSDKSKVKTLLGTFVCPNGHIIIIGDDELVEQPRSTGSSGPHGINVYRLNTKFGSFCDEKGVELGVNWKSWRVQNEI